MIGVFDSGVGGMTVARAIEEALPGCGIVYFGDLARTPYGSKSPETITRYALENSRFLLEQGARILVIACNSAASVAADAVRREFDVPVFEVIEPAVARAAAVSRSGRIGVIGTRATIASRVYEDKIRALRPDARVYGAACPLLVPLVEEGWLKRRETRMILRRYLAPLKRRRIDTLVLGCTHYPLLAAEIRPRAGKRVRVIDSSVEVAARIRSHLEDHPGLAASLARGRPSRYHVSDITPAAAGIARMIFGREIKLERT